MVFETGIDLVLEVKGFGQNVCALKRADKVILGIDRLLIERDLQACTAGINLRGFCIRAGFLRENLFPFLWVIFCPLISALDALK